MFTLNQDGGVPIPQADDLIEAAARIRQHAMDWAAGGFDTDELDNAARLLEHCAIVMLPRGAARDELLEGRTDLGQPATIITEKEA